MGVEARVDPPVLKYESVCRNIHGIGTCKHGKTFVDKKGADGQKIKGKSFVVREPVTDQLWQTTYKV